MTLNDASERHKSAQQISLDLLQGAEQVNDFEVSAKLLQLQTQLQASFQTTALVSTSRWSTSSKRGVSKRKTPGANVPGVFLVER